MKALAHDAYGATDVLQLRDIRLVFMRLPSRRRRTSQPDRLSSSSRITNVNNRTEKATIRELPRWTYTGAIDLTNPND
jgi:hypothetical protein